MDKYRKKNESNLGGRYWIKVWSAPPEMTFFGLLHMLREDFKSGLIEVREDGDWDMKTFGYAAYEYDYYISHTMDTHTGFETLNGTTAEGHHVQVSVSHNDGNAWISVMSRELSAELEQIIIM